MGTQLWKLDGDSLSNKGNIWNSNDKWALRVEGFLVCIQNVSNGKVLCANEDHSVIQRSFDQNNAGQWWIKGKPDSNGYFKLTKSSTKLVLSAGSDNCLRI